MMSFAKVTALLAGIALAAAATLSGPAAAQNSQPVPKSWNYEIKDGKRVPKAERKANADGSWREEVRQGNCVTVKEKSATGEYKESRRCD